MSDAVIVSILTLLVAILGTIVTSSFRFGRMLADVLSGQKAHDVRIDTLEKHDTKTRLGVLEMRMGIVDKVIERDLTPTPVFIGPHKSTRHNR